MVQVAHRVEGHGQCLELRAHREASQRAYVVVVEHQHAQIAEMVQARQGTITERSD